MNIILGTLTLFIPRLDCYHGTVTSLYSSLLRLEIKERPAFMLSSNGTVLWTNFAADDLLCNFVLAQEKRRKGLYYLREKPKVKAQLEAGFQFPRQPCNTYLIEKTLSLKSTVKLR